ncbi:BRCA1-associated RING domain protein 1 isoform X2 [Jatropha curcas]|uniref:BRCA1-associated RING domain protein 1 isoform X2 n=1 Tax=Jatropha curcas TaxID=180498 RepID=UPI0009D747C9|nr:BRCA1-associated RING domain protein 1 isoform X2 [Jatropha curcas]
MVDSTKQCSVRSINPWVLHLQKLGLELKCPLCLNLLKRPFLLPCDHIFCNSCLPETKQFGSQCPVCKAQYVGKDLRLLPFIENMVTIYRSLDASFCPNLFQSSSSDTRSLEQCPTSTSADCNDKCKESFKASQEDNSSSGRSMFLQTGNKLAQVTLNCPVENEVPRIDMEGKCNMARGLKDKEYEMVGSAGYECDGEKNVNSPPVNSQTRAVGIHERGTMQMAMNQSPQNYQALRLAKRNTGERTKEDRHGGSDSGTDIGNLRDSKRHKKLNYGPLNACTNGTRPISSQAENLETCYSHSEHKPLSLVTDEPLAPFDDSSVVKTVCGFCQSSRISKDTGPMLHYLNGKSVEGDEASMPNCIHVHRLCIEWAPQVYFVDETVKNLKAELARGAKLKCSGCGLKGAALGCYHKSCRRSYHVTCAMEIAGCRWDYDNFLVLCPSHCSVRFPDEKKAKSKSKKHKLENHHVPTQITTQQPYFWAESSGVKEWVFCGSALSSEEKCLLVEFGSMIGVPVTKFWRPNVTHVIAATDTKGACTRTLKVLMAILNGRWVLTIDWVKACMKAMCPVDEEPYEVSLDNHGCQNGPKTGRLGALDNAPKLFNGMNFYFSGDFVSGYKEDLQNLVINAGGNIVEKKEELVEQSHDQAAAPSRTLVVYNLDPPQGYKLGEEVTILWQRLNEAEDLAAKIGSQVIGHTWVLESIASYKLQPFVSMHNIRNGHIS